MDYFEGLFLGTQWSDTDYENRAHWSLFFAFGAAVWIAILFHAFTGVFGAFFDGVIWLKIVLFVILFLVSPFINLWYYRYPLWAKLLILAAQGVKYLMLTLLLTAFAVPRMTLSTEDLQVRLIDYLNETLEASTLRFQETAGSLATVLGVVWGGIYIVFFALIIMLIAILIPGMLFILAKLLQKGYDMLITRFALADLLDR